VPKVRFPASSPFVTACGGTRLDAMPPGFAETAWSSSGGGWSAVFTAPEWQKDAVAPFGQGPRRGVPDVVGHADPGYPMRIHGMWVVEGGTSSAAPLWAALCARINQALARPIGFLNPILYRELAGSDALRVWSKYSSALETKEAMNVVLVNNTEASGQ
jgi:kumamolisin